MAEATFATQARQDPTDGISEILMNIVVALLAPMFLGACAGDVRFARMAAIETVNAYRTRNQADLLTIAQIVGFGVAALSSLTLAMTDDISLSMTLRLRGNATALNRAAEQNRRALRQTSPAHSAPDPSPSAVVTTEPEWEESPTAAAVANAQHLNETARDIENAIVNSIHATRPTKNQGGNRAFWASAMADEAAKLTGALTGMPPGQRQEATLRAAALITAAAQLSPGKSTPDKTTPARK